jgi:hypothetical protein
MALSNCGSDAWFQMARTGGAGGGRRSDPRERDGLSDSALPRRPAGGTPGSALPQRGPGPPARGSLAPACACPGRSRERPRAWHQHDGHPVRRASVPGRTPGREPGTRLVALAAGRTGPVPVRAPQAGGGGAARGLGSQTRPPGRLPAGPACPSPAWAGGRRHGGRVLHRLPDHHRGLGRPVLRPRRAAGRDRPHRLRRPVCPPPPRTRSPPSGRARSCSARPGAH